MNAINLRSDTVTEPTPEMRKAMAQAEVGDDYYRTDPTVIQLEERAAALLGKESALLVLSGTMGNLVSLLALSERGQTIIVGDRAHILLNEGGNISAVGGVTLRTVDAPNGVISPQVLASAILPRGHILFAATSVVCLENTHALSGGRCLTKRQIDDVCDVAAEHGIRVHMDGARIFNAAVARKTSAAALAEKVDTTTFCLTKGLGCPAGSLIVADRGVIEEARRWRQMVGGGMRQAGIFAAAGLVALDNIERLEEDHVKARRLATLLAEAGLPLDPSDFETNMVFVDLPANKRAQADFVRELAANGVIINSIRDDRARFVAHSGVLVKDIDAAAPIIARAYRAATNPIAS